MITVDLAIIGGGPGGYVAAIRAAQLGMSVAVIEAKAELGGTCLNVGCIPSKALLESSHLYERMLIDAQTHGIECAAVSMNITTMIERKNAIVKKLTTGISELLRSNGIIYIHGWGSLRDKHTIEVQASHETWNGSETDASEPLHTLVTAQRIVLACGSSVRTLLDMPYDGVHIINSEHALAFTEVPPRLLILGAGVIGLEMASIWSRLGSQVRIIEMAQSILPDIDGDASSALRKALQKKNIYIDVGMAVKNMYIENDIVHVEAHTIHEEMQSYEAEKLLVAIGRTPNSADIGLAELGVTIDAQGFVAVNELYQTSVDTIYAIGDLIRGPLLAHRAQEDAMVAVERMHGISAHLSYAHIPKVVYTSPELASVGYTQEQLEQNAIAYKTGMFSFGANGRALAKGESYGFVKILSDPHTDRILGAHIVGPYASELIAELVVVMEFDGSSEDIARIIHVHPSLGEVIREAALAVDERALHMMPKTSHTK